MAKTRTAPSIGSELVQALEALYHRIAVQHPDLPDRVVINTGSGISGRSIPRWGHFAANRWTETRGKTRQAVPEIFLAGERLDCGPVETLSTMLHEAAHALAEIREIQDTSRNGAYHNQRFREIAEEVGLDVTKSDRNGWNITSVPPRGATAAAYSDELKALRKAIRATITIPDAVKNGSAKGAKTGAGAEGDQAPKSRNNAKIVCQCDEPRILRMSRKAFDAGPVSCGLCGTDFAYAEN